MYRRAYTLLVGTAVVMWLLAFIVSLRYDLPLIEPEGKLLGPSLTWMLDLVGAMPTNLVLVSVVLLIDMFLRAFTILLAALAIDMAANGLWNGRRKLGRFWPAAKERYRTHWTRERMTLVVLGTTCFYITYVCYRNLKSSLPIVRSDPDDPTQALSYDRELHVMDRILFFGQDPSDVLHAVFGHTITAHILSAVYLSYLPLVVTLVAVWLVWSRNLSFGYWFVTSQVLGWSLGTLSYYLLPTLGPGIEYPSEYADLAHTGVTDLMDGITAGRTQLLHDSTVEGLLSSVAGFASLHVAIALLWALMIHHTVRSRVLKWVGWIYFALTTLATLYFGWHYVADDIGGVAIAVVAFYFGGIASGQKFERALRSHPTTTTSKVPIDAD